MAPDWRERKKARTKEAIRNAALRLFLEQGFEQTTVAQIAEAAGVSHMTFFRYFPAKEDVVLSDDFDPLLEGLIRAGSSGRPVQRVRRAVVEGLGRVYPAEHDALLSRTRLMLSTPALRGGLWDNFMGTQRLLERALSGADPEAASPGVKAAAGACAGVLTTVILDWARSEEPGDLLARIDEAFAALASETG